MSKITLREEASRLADCLRRFAAERREMTKTVFTLPEMKQNALGVAEGYERAAQFLKDILEMSIDE